MSPFIERRPRITDHATATAIEARGGVIGEHDEPCIEIIATTDAASHEEIAIRVPLEIADVWARLVLGLIIEERIEASAARRKRRRKGDV